MSDEKNIEEDLKTVIELLKRLLQQQQPPAPSSKPTITVPLGGSPGAIRQRWSRDAAELEEEYYDDYYSNPFGYQYRPPQISDRYLGGLNNLLGDTLAWVSESANVAASILRSPL